MKRAVCIDSIELLKIQWMLHCYAKTSQNVTKCRICN